MKIPIKKFYEYKRSYDYGDFWSMIGKRVTKHRSHKRLRQQLKKEMKREEVTEVIK